MCVFVFVAYLGPGSSAFRVGDDEDVVVPDLEVFVDVLGHFPE